MDSYENLILLNFGIILQNKSSVMYNLIILLVKFYYNTLNRIPQAYATSCSMLKERGHL